MKLKMRRLFAFFLALLFFVPAGVPAAAQGAQISADDMLLASIVSSEPQNDIHTMNFSVKQDTLPSSYYADYMIERATFVFSYDPSIIVPVDNQGADVSIGDNSEDDSPFIAMAGGSMMVDWLSNSNRMVVRATWTSADDPGTECKSLTPIFSFSYRLADGKTGYQGAFRIESDPSVLNPLFTKMIERITTTNNKSDYYERYHIGGIVYRLGASGRTPSYFKAKAENETYDKISVAAFTYPGCAGTTGNDIADIDLYRNTDVIRIDGSDPTAALIAVARNADGARIPYSAEDSIEWGLEAQNPKVEAFRQADIAEGNNSVTLTNAANGICSIIVKPTAWEFHHFGNNEYTVTFKVTSSGRTYTKQSTIYVQRGVLEELRAVTCTVTGGVLGDRAFVYHFPAEGDTNNYYISQDLLTIPRPPKNQQATYIFDFTFFSDKFQEEIEPQSNNHFQLINVNQAGNSQSVPTSGVGPSSFVSNSTKYSLGKVENNAAKQLTVVLNSDSTKQSRTGIHSLSFWVNNGRASGGSEYDSRFIFDFYVSDISYEWPDLFMQDTPLIMKPSQTYGELFEELKARDSGNFFKDYATIPYKTPEERLPGAVTVENSDQAPEDGKNNYVTFTFTVNNPGGSYDGQKLQFAKPVKIATLPTEPISATIAQVDGEAYNGQPIELEVTKSQLVKAGDLQALGFPSTVSLSWDGGSTQVSGSDLKFDTALAVLQALNVGDTMDVSLQPPADNITLTNGLTVKVKVVPTGLGAGAGTVALPAGTTYTYTGSPLTPAPTVTVGGVMLNKDTDYTVEYMDNVNAGTGKIIITGKGNYSGTIEKDFTISKAPLPGVTVDGADLTTADPKYYTAQAGDVLTPKFENGLDPSIADWVWKEQGTDTVVSNKRVYVPKAAYAGKEIYAEASAKPNSNYTGTVTSLPVKILIPISGSVYIKADPASGGGGAPVSIGLGTELTAVITPDYPITVTWDYQWKKNGTNIPGATGETYTLKADDTSDGAGNFSRITVSVTPKTGSPATGGLKSEDAVTVGKKPLDVGTVTVTRESPGGAGGVIGGAQPGDKLIASVTPTGGGEAPANPPYKFVWIKDGTPIDGEEGPEYTLKPEDKGKEITVAVVPKDDSGDYTGTVPSETDPTKVPPTKPGSPENVTVTPGSGGGSVKVSWDPPADDGGEPIEEYKVVVKDGDGNTVAEVPVDHDKNNCEVPVPDGDKEYKAEVVAVNNVGGSDPATPADPAKPDPKPTSKPGSGGGYVPWNPTPKPSPSPDPTSSPSPGPTASPSPDPWPSDCPRDETCPIAPFPDSNPKAWYHDGLHFCTGKDLMNGYANGLLGPNDPMTRAQLAMILYNMEDRPDNSGLSGFTDVPPDAWYAKAVTWANEEQVMVGYDNGCFGPNDPVTREQMTATLYRYAGSPPAGGSLEQFTDWREVSDYAKESMAWAVGKGLVSGIGNNRLSPRGTSTRAQVGTIIYLYCKLVSYPGA